MGLFSLLSLSEFLGANEHALRLVVSISFGYPIILFHRFFMYGRSSLHQHLLFIVTGLVVGLFNFGWDVLHLVATICTVYAILIVFGGSIFGVLLTFTFTMSYLLYGYYITSTDLYDIKWTMPHCVLTLKLTGVAFDLYDGSQPQETLSTENKKSALTSRPSLLELFAHAFFPSAFLVGPQFHMRRYQQFIAGNLIPSSNSTNLPNCIRPAIMRFAAGIGYLSFYQILTIWVPESYLDSDSFMELGFFSKHLVLGLWGRAALYKYISCWLITEGVCIMSGISYSGKDEKGLEKWDGCANVHLKLFEGGLKFNHYIMSFNINTNLWVAQYIYKRLKFMNNKLASQAGALLFLAVWHGFHSGYYVCFFNEFIVMLMEKEVESIIAKNQKVTAFLSSSHVYPFVWILLKVYTFVFMGFCLVPFVLLSYNRYITVYKSIWFSGWVFFLGWHLYAPFVRKALRPHRHSPGHQD